MIQVFSHLEKGVQARRRAAGIVHGCFAAFPPKIFSLNRQIQP
jgi:hypothetical protein